jgi:hypothetical protein
MVIVMRPAGFVRSTVHQGEAMGSHAQLFSPDGSTVLQTAIVFVA